MSDEQQSEFFDHLKRLDFLANWLRWLIIGIFGLGCWVTSIQMELAVNTKGALSRETRIRELELSGSVTTERLTTALHLLERIDRKINP
jgi:hypothetical protein